MWMMFPIATASMPLALVVVRLTTSQVRSVPCASTYVAFSSLIQRASEEVRGVSDVTFGADDMVLGEWCFSAASAGEVGERGERVFYGLFDRPAAAWSWVMLM